MTVAVVVDLDANRLNGVDNRAVYLFDTKRDAVIWQYQRLVGSGLVVRNANGMQLVCGQAFYGALEEEQLVDEWKDQLEFSERFEIFDVRKARFLDQRTVDARTASAD